MFCFLTTSLDVSGLGRIHSAFCDYATVFPALPLWKVAHSEDVFVTIHNAAVNNAHVLKVDLKILNITGLDF